MILNHKYIFGFSLKLDYLLIFLFSNIFKFPYNCFKLFFILFKNLYDKIFKLFAKLKS